MAAKFVLKKGSTGKFRFNLVATNGQVIATSEAYESKASAIKGIESVKRNVPTAEIDDQPDQEPAVPHDAVIGLAVPGRPIGPWSRRTGAPEASATRRDRNPRCSRSCSRDAPRHPGMSGYRGGTMRWRPRSSTAW
jgi:uncharacterized protein